MEKHIGVTICIGREIWCLPFAWFFFSDDDKIGLWFFLLFQLDGVSMLIPNPARFNSTNRQIHHFYILWYLECPNPLQHSFFYHMKNSSSFGLGGAAKPCWKEDLSLNDLMTMAFPGSAEYKGSELPVGFILLWKSVTTTFLTQYI